MSTQRKTITSYKEFIANELDENNNIEANNRKLLRMIKRSESINEKLDAIAELIINIGKY